MIFMIRSACLVFASCVAWCAPPLPNSTSWEFPQDIVAEQYRELRQYYERAISAARDKRSEPDLAELLGGNVIRVLRAAEDVARGLRSEPASLARIADLDG